jgi:hypothetical protein
MLGVELIYIAENDLKHGTSFKAITKFAQHPKILTIYIKSLDFYLKNGYANNMFKRFKLIY